MGARVLGVTVLGVVVLAGVVSAPTVAQSCDSGSSEVTGAVVGAVSGGLLGAAIVSGDGQRVAIMVGAIAGGLLGHRFGASLDCDQQRYHSPTVREALELARTGETTERKNPDTGHWGTVTPVLPIRWNGACTAATSTGPPQLTVILKLTRLPHLAKLIRRGT
jgi:surface antigen